MTNKNHKRQYRIRNWQEYNKALVGRGSLTLWLDSRSINTWRDHSVAARRGRRRTYSDVAVRCALTLREVYGLPLRATQGLVRSVLRLLRLDLPAPHYSTICRRARGLDVRLTPTARCGSLHLVVDSTGLKVYGEGEWKAHLHGQERRRTWRKLHVAMDHRTHEVMACVTSDKDLLDRRFVPTLLGQVEGRVAEVLGDGAYDFEVCYEAIQERGARSVIPPKKGARVRGTAVMRDRDESVLRVRQVGTEQWKRESGYHRRSLVETTMMRLKTVFGERLKSRRLDRQATEVRIRCAALNRMTQLGMPRSYEV